MAERDRIYKIAKDYDVPLIKDDSLEIETAYCVPSFNLYIKGNTEGVSV